MLASSACSAAWEVYKVEARSGTGDDRYDSGVSGRWLLGVCGREGVLYATTTH
jgi:hypothetical protein